MSRPVRSILCVPGHRTDWIEKARANDLYGADQLLLDLEDSVPDVRKEEAREVVSAYMTPVDAVRINSGAEFDRDMDMLEFFEGTIWVPKVTGANTVSLVYSRRRPVQRSASTAIVACIESPGGVLLGLREILCYPSLWEGLAFGKHDFIASAGISPWQADAIAHAAAQVALAAAARSVPCWMAPSLATDWQEVSWDAHDAWSLGFTGMGCITPSQVTTINAAFNSREGSDLAERLIAAAEANPNEAVFRTPDGDLVSPPTVAWARRVLGC